ncbi:Sugar kinase, partial [human gut metagenome]
TMAPGGLGERRVLTPHAGEAAALISELGVRRTRQEVEAAPAAAARRLATLTGATVVLKGTPTLVAR